MKRKSNGIVIGTILIVLVGALVFVQSQNQEPEDEEMPPVPAGDGHPDGHSAPNVNDRLDAPPNTGPMVAPPG